VALALVGLWFSLTVLLLALAAVPGAMQRYRWLGVAAIALALGASLALAWNTTPQAAPRWQGGFVYDGLAHLVLPALWTGVAGAMGIALLAWPARYELPIAAAATTTATAGVLSASPLLVVALLQVGALAVLAGLLLPGARAGTQPLLGVATGLKYLTLTVIGAACLIMSLLLANFYALNQDRVELPRIIAALFAIGFGLAAGSMPFYFALPDLFDAAPTLATVSVVGPLQCLAFVYLLRTAANDPWLLTDAHVTGLLAAVALAGSLLAAILAFGQRSLSRALAFNCMRELGWLAFGIASVTRAGWTGALVLLAARCVTQPLLIVAAELIQRHAGSNAADKLHGIGRTLPGVAIAWTAAAFATIGLPPTPNFWGVQSLVGAGFGSGFVPAAVLLVSLVIGAWQLGIVTVPMFASKRTAAGQPASGPRRWLMGAAALGILAAGVTPHLFQAPVAEALAAFPFLR
jgi:NADH-quinone oxidoreductase subunit N